MPFVNSITLTITFTPAPYSYFRYYVTSVVSGSMHQINEIEYFGTADATPTLSSSTPADDATDVCVVMLLSALSCVQFFYRYTVFATVFSVLVTSFSGVSECFILFAISPARLGPS